MDKVYAIVWDISSYDGDLLLSLWSNESIAHSEMNRLISTGNYEKENLNITTIEVNTDSSKDFGETILI